MTIRHPQAPAVVVRPIQMIALAAALTEAAEAAAAMETAAVMGAVLGVGEAAKETLSVE